MLRQAPADRTQTSALGLALRPTVESALSHSENFDVVLSKVCDAWRSVTAEE
jgi:hypothetical protein